MGYGSVRGSFVLRNFPRGNETFSLSLLSFPQLFIPLLTFQDFISQLEKEVVRSIEMLEEFKIPCMKGSKLPLCNFNS